MALRWRIMGALIGLLLPTVLAGSPIEGEIAWILRPGYTAPDQQRKTVPVGAFLFVQPMHAHSEAMVEAGHEGSLPFILGKKVSVRLTDQRFMETTGGIGGTTYCSLATFERKGQRLCLIDANSDGKFDYQTRAFGIGGGAPFASSLPSKGLPASIPYTIRKDVQDIQLYSGLILKKTGDAYELRLAVSENGSPEVLDLFLENRIVDRRRIKPVGTTFDPHQLPAKVGLYGAEIEITALANGQITYRVLSGFDPDAIMTVSRSGSMPIPR